MSVLSIFIVLAFVALAASQCTTANPAPSSSFPQLCTPSYSVPLSVQNSSTSNIFITLNNSAVDNQQPIPYACAKLFAAFYCSTVYPKCPTGADNTSACASTCHQMVSACSGYMSYFNFTNLPIKPPTNGSMCDVLYNANQSTCTSSASSDTNLAVFYGQDPPLAEACTYKQIPLTNDPRLEVCAPTYLMPIQNAWSTLGDQVHNGLLNYAKSYQDSVGPLPYNCSLAYTQFYCSVAYNQCPASQAVAVDTRACASGCHLVATYCAPYASYFNSSYFSIPSSNASCDALYSSASTCTYTNQIDLAFFFPNGSGSTTGSGTGSSSMESGSIYYYQEDWVRGGILGAGMLVGLMMIVGGLVLIMKKQDSK